MEKKLFVITASLEAETAIWLVVAESKEDAVERFRETTWLDVISCEEVGSGEVIRIS